MSDEPNTSTDGPGPVTRACRTVTPPYRGRADAGMNAVGWGMFLGLVVLLVPLLPFIVPVRLVSEVTGTLAGGVRE